MNRRLVATLLPVLGLHAGACIVAVAAVRGASFGVNMKTNLPTAPLSAPSSAPSYRLESWQLEQKIRTA